jgi:hypothetical protein
MNTLKAPDPQGSAGPAEEFLPAPKRFLHLPKTRDICHFIPLAGEE